MAKVLDHFPDVSDRELVYLRNLIEDLEEKRAKAFAAEYFRRRRSPGLIMVLTLIGFLGLAGLQRFALGKVGTGFLFLFTLGFVGIGTAIDLIRYEKMAYDHNRFAAQRVDIIVRGDAVER